VLPSLFAAEEGLVVRSKMDRQSNATSSEVSSHVGRSRLCSLDAIGNHGSIDWRYAETALSGVKGSSLWTTAFLRWLGAIGSEGRNVSDPGDCEGVGPKYDALETSYSHLRPNLQAVSVSNIVHNEFNSIFVRIPCTESTIWDCAVASLFRFTT
jgi:hypothetical protein